MHTFISGLVLTFLARCTEMSYSYSPFCRKDKHISIIDATVNELEKEKKLTLDGHLGDNNADGVVQVTNPLFGLVSNQPHRVVTDSEEEKGRRVLKTRVGVSMDELESDNKMQFQPARAKTVDFDIRTNTESEKQQSVYLREGESHSVWKPKQRRNVHLASQDSSLSRATEALKRSEIDLFLRQKSVEVRVHATQAVLRNEANSIDHLESESARESVVKYSKPAAQFHDDISHYASMMQIHEQSEDASSLSGLSSSLRQRPKYSLSAIKEQREGSVRRTRSEMPEDSMAFHSARSQFDRYYSVQLPPRHAQGTAVSPGLEENDPSIETTV